MTYTGRVQPLCFWKPWHETVCHEVLSDIQVRGADLARGTR